MELREQVVSLDLAKRLKWLEVPQNSYFYWFPGKKFGPLASELEDIWLLEHKLVSGENYSAFSTSELGEMLPQGYATWWYAKQDGKGMTLFRCANNQYDDAKAFEAETEADARAKMLIYLLENGLVKSEGLTKE